MGTVPIVNISPLTITRSDEPTLEPLVPVARIESPSASTDETYSPSGEQTASGSEDSEDGESEDQCNDSGDEAEAQPSSTEPSETLAIDFFA
jgi:hypothetical protein